MNKIIIAISLVLNGVLIMLVTGVIPFVLFLSFVINGALLWYVSNLFRKNQQMADDMQEIYSLLDGFEEHLENVHSLEMFYGDDTLQGLIDHSRQLINSLHYYIYEDSIDEPTDEETSIGALDFDNEPRTEEEETPKI